MEHASPMIDRSKEELRACNQWQVQLIEFWQKSHPEMSLEEAAGDWIGRYAGIFGSLFDKRKEVFVQACHGGLTVRDLESMQAYLDQQAPDSLAA